MPAIVPHCYTRPAAAGTCSVFCPRRARSAACQAQSAASAVVQAARQGILMRKRTTAPSHFTQLRALTLAAGPSMVGCADVNELHLLDADKEFGLWMG